MNNKLLFSEIPSKTSRIDGFQSQCHSSFGREKLINQKKRVVEENRTWTKVSDTNSFKSSMNLLEWKKKTFDLEHPLKLVIPPVCTSRGSC